MCLQCTVLYYVLREQRTDHTESQRQGSVRRSRLMLDLVREINPMIGETDTIYRYSSVRRFGKWSLRSRNGQYVLG
jgi:hypothetical protein